jgi:hypothetical protein
MLVISAWITLVMLTKVVIPLLTIVTITTRVPMTTVTLNKKSVFIHLLIATTIMLAPMILV